jgi:hypothetical protein
VIHSSEGVVCIDDTQTDRFDDSLLLNDPGATIANQYLLEWTTVKIEAQPMVTRKRLHRIL